MGLPDEEDTQHGPGFDVEWEAQQEEDRRARNKEKERASKYEVCKGRDEREATKKKREEDEARAL